MTGPAPEWRYMVTEYGHGTPFSRAADQIVISGLTDSTAANFVPDLAAGIRALDSGDDYHSFRDKSGRYCQLRRYPANTIPRERRR